MEGGLKQGNKVNDFGARVSRRVWVGKKLKGVAVLKDRLDGTNRGE